MLGTISKLELYTTLPEGGQVSLLSWLAKKEKINLLARNIHGHQPIHTAAIHGQWKAVEWFLEHGSDGKALDFQGFNIVHWAAFNKDISGLERIIEYGISLEHMRIPRTKALHIAALQDNLDVLIWLLEHGTKVNQLDF